MTHHLGQNMLLLIYCTYALSHICKSVPTMGKSTGNYFLRENQLIYSKIFCQDYVNDWFHNKLPEKRWKIIGKVNKHHAQASGANLHFAVCSTRFPLSEKHISAIINLIGRANIGIHSVGPYCGPSSVATRLGIKQIHNTTEKQKETENSMLTDTYSQLQHTVAYSAYFKYVIMLNNELCTFFIKTQFQSLKQAGD